MKLPFAYVNRATLAAVRADFVKKEMRLTITIRPDDKSLAMRDVLTALAIDEQPLLVTLEPIEPSLNDLPLFAAAEAEAARIREGGQG